MKTIGVTANCRKELAPRILEVLLRSASDLGLRVLADHETASLSKDVEGVSSKELGGVAEVLVVLGGDGTMLRAVRSLEGKDVPVMGVNLGSLGFMTSVAESDMEKAVRALAAGDYTIDERALAECLVTRDGRPAGSYLALNDVVINRGASTRIVTLDMKIGEDKGTLCVCDGLIVSTPTGSTGHSLSAGGPVLHPATSVFVVTLICPHALSARPIVVPDCMPITATMIESSGQLSLAVDGQVGQALDVGDSVVVRKAGSTARFVSLPGYSYFSVLRHKLHWRAANV